MAVYDTDDEIPVIEGEPERQPATAAAFDMKSFAAEMARANAEAMQNVLGKFAESMRPAEKPRPTNPGSLLRDKFREHLGLDDDELVERSFRASALDAISDEYGDDPAVRSAIKARTSDASLIRALAESNRRVNAMQERMDKQEADSKARAARDKLLAQFESGDLGELKQKAPRLFDGPMSEAKKKLMRVLVDGGTPDDLLPVLDELISSQQPRNKRFNASPGGTGTDKPQAFEVVSDAEWSSNFDRAASGEEMN